MNRDSYQADAVLAQGARWLHCLSAILLLVLAAAHFSDLKSSRIAHDLNNTVFPFLTNRTVYFMAGAFEVAAGLLCVRYRGRDLANIVILTFVATMLWYRWAFDLTGGTRCGCLGILGRMLHLSSGQEKNIESGHGN
jgi:hypothetical protein